MVNQCYAYEIPQKLLENRLFNQLYLLKCKGEYVKDLALEWMGKAFWQQQVPLFKDNQRPRHWGPLSTSPPFLLGTSWWPSQLWFQKVVNEESRERKIPLYSQSCGKAPLPIPHPPSSLQGFTEFSQFTLIHYSLHLKKQLFLKYIIFSVLVSVKESTITGCLTITLF